MIVVFQEEHVRFIECGQRKSKDLPRALSIAQKAAQRLCLQRLNIYAAKTPVAGKYMDERWHAVGCYASLNEDLIFAHQEELIACTQLAVSTAMEWHALCLCIH